MPLDTRIPMGFQPPQFANPLDMALKGGQLAQLAQQMQGQRFKQQMAEQEMAKEQQFRQGIEALGPNASPGALAQLAARFAPPKDVLLQLTASEDRKARIEATKAATEGNLAMRAGQLQIGQQTLDLRRDQMLANAKRDEDRAKVDEWYKRESLNLKQEQNNIARMIAELRGEQIRQGNKPPEGYRWTAEGNQEVVPGGPADRKAKGKEEGRGQISTITDSLAAHYDTLEKLGAVIQPKQSVVKNVWERAAASGPGQLVAGAIGTKAQEIRDQIANSKPLLMAAIKQATGMSAQQLNSNAELQFYLQAATDPAKILEANRAALAVLDQTYGMGTGVRASQKAIDAIKKEAPNKGTTAKPGGVKFLGFE